MKRKSSETFLLQLWSTALLPWNDITSSPKISSTKSSSLRRTMKDLFHSGLPIMIWKSFCWNSQIKTWVMWTIREASLSLKSETRTSQSTPRRWLLKCGRRFLKTSSLWRSSYRLCQRSLVMSLLKFQKLAMTSQSLPTPLSSLSIWLTDTSQILKRREACLLKQAIRQSTSKTLSNNL